MEMTARSDGELLTEFVNTGCEAPFEELTQRHSGLVFGVCLRVLGRHADAEPFFHEAERRDPNGHYLIANIGWHYVETGDYAAARQWFQRAIRLSNYSEPIAENYLTICEARLLDQASGKPVLPSGF